MERVKPERDQNNRAVYREQLVAASASRGASFAPALAGLPRYIATVETAKHRVFAFLDAAILPGQHARSAIASTMPSCLACCPVRIHVVWALAAGGTLGGSTRVTSRPRCFEPFPFPADTPTALSSPHPRPRRTTRRPPQAPAGARTPTSR
ncbi:MAG: hypothetical protein MZV65_38840 [Chromatiales bacterium]|nr:hypothetical protein [Chromatiales bacterium]